MDVQMIIDNFVDVVKNKYILFTGRARRREYWLFFLATFVIGVGLSVIASIFTAIHLGAIGWLFSGVSYLVSLALMLPGLGLMVRRLHDIGKDWPYIFIALIPFVGGIILLVWACQEGNPGDNQFGPNPKA
jgi:uncharacterized membrane protein YhaH (DUF805 family)